MDREQLLRLANAYKEQIYARLLEMVPKRLVTFDPDVLEGKTTEEMLTLVYMQGVAMQGVAEALDAFDMAELLRATAREAHDPDSGMQA